MFKNKMVLVILSFFLFFSQALFAAKHVREEVDEAFGLFLGPTYDKGKNLFTYGFEYHRIVSFPFGFLLDAESIPWNREGDTEYELFGLAVVNLHHHIIAGVGPGLKFAKEEREEEEGKKKVQKLMGRLFVGYVIELAPEFEVTPNASLDFTEGTRAKEINYGLTFAKQF